MGQEESVLVMQKEVDPARIQELCMSFMKECPSGALHLHEFKRILGIQNASEEESVYIETIFRSFDTNKDNAIDFMEYVAALHLMLRGKLEDRLKWSFKVYDQDGNGRLDRQEVTRIIKIIYKIKSKNKNIDMMPAEICDRIFQLIDENDDGQISLAEFMEGAQKDPWLLDMLALDVNASAWVSQNWSKTT
ncbi:guanylyl cyclase-activating protein 2-like [Denticeps clupeoides]|uniref:EF-hand domain-containing protein n=1 Tax=Denticeps clupeoides TaxID=299321 RepID=A0AAY4CK02_9TELE|nr:guanylyl cyclase-activating protein 2-like [Denticeps clupeoides]